ncbi:MAG: PilZ domain-containing protein, partial [Litorimonas sp.]
AAAVRLSRLVEGLSLAEILRTDARALTPPQRDALTNYMLTLRETAALSRSGLHDEAQALLSARVTPELFAGLSALDSDWSCRMEAGDPAASDDALPERPEPETAPEGDSVSGSGLQAGVAPELADSMTDGGPAAGSSSGDSGPAGRQRFAPADAIVGGDTMVFTMMVLVMALLGLLFYAQRRFRQTTAREARRTLDQPVRVLLDGRTLTLRLIDVSMNGAKIGHAAQLSEGMEVGLQLAGTWHSGTIRWNNDNFAGLKFKRTLNAADLSVVTGKKRPAPEGGLLRPTG